MWQEGGDGHQDGNPEQATSREAEERAQEAIEEAQTDGMGRAIQRLAEKGAEHHNPDHNKKKGDNLSDRRRGDNAPENDRDVLVVPAGKQNSSNQAADGEELKDDAAQKRHHGGVGEQRDEKTVEEVHAILGISEIGTSGNQAECLKVLLAGT